MKCQSTFVESHVGHVNESVLGSDNNGNVPLGNRAVKPPYEISEYTSGYCTMITQPFSDRSYRIVDTVICMLGPLGRFHLTDWIISGS